MNDVATCGTCRAQWHFDLYPTPASLCPWCNGDERGVRSADAVVSEPAPLVTRSENYVAVVWADAFGVWHARVTDGPTARRRAVAAIRRAIGEQPGMVVRVEATESKDLRVCQVVGQTIYRER